MAGKQERMVKQRRGEEGSGDVSKNARESKQRGGHTGRSRPGIAASPLPLSLLLERKTGYGSRLAFYPPRGERRRPLKADPDKRETSRKSPGGTSSCRIVETRELYGVTFKYVDILRYGETVIFRAIVMIIDFFTFFEFEIGELFSCIRFADKKLKLC